MATKLILHRLIIVLKARQIGVSWLLAAYALWIALYSEGAKVLLLSKGQGEATELLDKVKFIHDHLPERMRQEIGAESKSVLEFPNLQSKIEALPSTENAGRGPTASVVIQDEADFHQHLDVNYAAIKPTVDAGGQLIQASTSNKLKVTSLFKQLWRGSPTNGFITLFYGWRVRPGRDDHWFDLTKAAVPVTEKMSPDLFMEQEYPATAEEALAPSKAHAYFDTDRLKEMLNECKEPIEVRLGGVVRIWQRPVVAGKYLAGGDLAWGETGAYSCLSICTFRTGVKVAEIHGRFHEDEMAQMSVDLLREYNNAFTGVERNGEGRLVVEKMVALGYGKYMYWHDHKKDKPEIPGWQTDGPSRPVLLGEYAEAIRLGSFSTPALEDISEMSSFIRGEDLKPGPAIGAYGDRVMANAIMWYMRNFAKFNLSSSEPIYAPMLF